MEKPDEIRVSSEVTDMYQPKVFEPSEEASGHLGK